MLFARRGNNNILCRYARRAFGSGKSEWKARVESLLQRSSDLDATIANKGLSRPLTQNESYSLFNDWRQILFQIPHDESKILSQSASHIDALLSHNLDELSKHNETAKPGFSPSHLLSEDVTTGIYAWGRMAALDDTSPMRAEALLKRFLEVSKNNNNNDDDDDDDDDDNPLLVPTSNMYSAMVYCWSQASQNKMATEKALEWFRKLQSNNNNNNNNNDKDVATTVDAATWNALIRIHVRQKKFAGMDRALLQDYSYLNDGYTFASLVQGWLDSNLPKQAHEELQKGMAFCLQREDQIPALQQLLFSYLSQSIERNRIHDAERVLSQAIRIQESHIELEILQTKHFVVVMNALAARGKSEQTNRLFQQFRVLYDRGAQQLEPNYQVMVILLSAIAKKNDRTSLKIGEELLSTIEAFLLHDQSPDDAITNHAHNVMLDLYVRSPHVDDKRERVETVIDRMTRLSEKYKNARLLPDKVSYASLMKAVVQDGKPGAFSEVQTILSQLEESNEVSMKPDQRIYAIVLETLFASSDDEAALEKARNLVERMKKHTKLHPDRVIYTILIKIHSLFRDVHGSDQVLHTMIQAYKSGRKDCRPNEEAFVTAMSTWEQSNRSDSMDGALRIFNDMVTLFKSGKHTDCKPTLKSFGKLMVVLAKCEDESKMERGRRLFSEMQKHGIVPDGSIFNWYIRVCATVKSQDETIRREHWNEAQETFDRLQENGMANSHTYNSMFHACDNLLQNQDDQRDMVRYLFVKCRDDGMVNRRILTSLKRSFSSNLFGELTGLDPKDNSIQMKQIPASWKRNNRTKHTR